MNFKYWITKDRALIVITNKSISYNKLKTNELISCFNDLNQMMIPEKLKVMDYCVVKKINFDDNNNRIDIYYNQKEKLSINIYENSIMDEIRTELVKTGPRYKNSIRIKENKQSINNITYLPVGAISLLSFNFFWFAGTFLCTLMITLFTFYRFHQNISPCYFIEEFKYTDIQNNNIFQPNSFL